MAQVKVTYDKFLSGSYGKCDDCGEPHEPGDTLYDKRVEMDNEPWRSDVICRLCYTEVKDD
ncbi:hypothetical protein SEA_LITTLEFELLA_67 [Gordonia phage LittleFella]|nr:hypothetical protein SEA_LITTLEFELLA_67 [Gordonia phage LittleFella]